MMIDILFLLILPLFFIGIINKSKAIFTGRKGAGIFQPFYDISRLLKKGEVISTTASFIFRVAPSVSLASTLLAGLLIPFVSEKAAFGFEGDFILFAYLLAIGRFFTLVGAMDTGSSFEGMGASREALFSAFAEPSFFIITSSLVYLSGYKSFSEIFLLLPKDEQWGELIIALSIIIFFVIILVEGSRVPVDDPNTHLELTMIHEVMVLDNSGPDLAMILYSTAMKMVIMGAIIANLIIPHNLNIFYAVLYFLGVIFILAVIIGFVESVMARLRMIHVPQFILVATSISLLALSLLMLNKAGGIK